MEQSTELYHIGFLLDEDWEVSPSADVTVMNVTRNQVWYKMELAWAVVWLCACHLPVLDSPLFLLPLLKYFE
jgi:hypothetical protein